MHLSKSADYALRALTYLAGLPAGTLVSGSAMAEATAVPEPFLLKVLRQLVRARLVNAQRGAGGGFQLALDPQQISMLRVIEAIDGPRDCDSCLVDGKPCPRVAWCGVHQVIAAANSHINQVLKGISIARLQRESEVRRGFVEASELARAGD